MAPHIENLVDSTIVAGTQHKTGDGSAEAGRAHNLAAMNPNIYREVGDDLGEACITVSRQHIRQALSLVHSERNPLVDDVE